MHLLLDLSHPAQAHALHFFILEMKKRGHEILVFARDKEFTHDLLNSWNIQFISKGKGKRSLPAKILDAFSIVWKMYFKARKFDTDMFISYSSYHAAITGWLMRKPVLTFEDTENVSLLHSINRFFSTYMITPQCFKGDFGEKHIRFNGYKELGYLHPNVFKPVAKSRINKSYIIIRFVAWKAWHDRGHKGISEEMKDRIIHEFSRFGEIYISSESSLPAKWEKYKLPVMPSDFHSFLSGASLFFGESASIAAEAAVLGIPSIYIGDTILGYIHELSNNYELIHQFGESNPQTQQALSKAHSLLSDPNTPETWQERKKRMLGEKMDVCVWMIDFVGQFLNRTRNNNGK